MHTRLITGLFATLFVLIASISPSYSAEQKSPLFVNLSTDDTWTAGMAIHFAKEAIKRGHQVTVFLNVRAVRLADTSIIHDTHGPKNKTIQQMISGIQQQGAKIIVCQGCMKKAGVTKEQLIDNVVVGKPETVFPALFEENTKVMSW